MRDLEKGDGYENFTQKHAKIIFYHFCDGHCCGLCLSIGRLFPGRNSMGFFVYSDTAWVLDHYKYDDRHIELILFLCGTEFISVYVWHDVEFLWVENDIG